MLRVSQIKCEAGHSEAMLAGKIRKKLRLSDDVPSTYEIVRQSVDARHKDNILFVYTADVKLKPEGMPLKKLEEKYVISVWEHTDADHTTVRFCTSWATKKENVDKLIEDIKRI